MPEELVSAAEVARILGVSRQRVAQLAREAADFPPSQGQPGERVWSRPTIEAWASAHQDRGPRSNGPKVPPAGDPASRLGQILQLAGAQARDLNHHWIGDDHLLLALLHPDCPGAARRVLTSLGVSLAEVRRAYVESMGDPYEPSSCSPGTTIRFHVLLERAILEAVQLRDEEITSQHVLLAMADNWGRGHSTAYLAGRGVDARAVRERVIAFTEETSPVQEPPPPRSLSRDLPPPKRIPRPPEPELALTPDGRDPRRRGPWGSAVFHDAEGRPITQGIALRQYFIDPRAGC